MPIVSAVQESWLRLKRSCRERGLLQTLGHYLRRPSYLAGRARSLLRYRSVEKFVLDEFDRRFGVDTRTSLGRTELEIRNDNVLYVTAYGTIPESLFHTAMEQVKDIDFGTFIFIDFGSGKGRALFMASDYPFKKIVGVELSPLLHAIAKQNLQKYQSPSQKCSNFVLINEDFVAYRLPEEPVFCYLYNPCEEAIMARLAENAAGSAAQTPRLIYVLYFAPRFGYLWEKAGFEKIAESGEGSHMTHYCIYRKAPQSP